MDLHGPYRRRPHDSRVLKRTLIPICVLAINVLLPITASLDNRDKGLQELRALVVTSDGRPAESALIGIESTYPGQRAGALARFLRGYLHYSGNNYQAASEALEPGEISALTSLGDYATFYRAESDTKIGRNKEALQQYSELNPRFPASLLVRESLLRAADLSLLLGDADGGIGMLALFVREQNPRAMYLTAQAYEKKGAIEQAARLYRAIYFERTASLESEQALARFEALKGPISQNPGSQSEMRARADALFNAKQYDEAAAAYSALVTRFESAATDEVHFRRGTSLLNNKQPVEAAASFPQVSNRDPALHAQALYNQAEALRRSNRASQSLPIVDRLISLYPNTRWAAAALYSLASSARSAGRKEEAASYFRRIFSLFPKSEFAPEASYTLGWEAYRAGQFAEAGRILEQHLASYRSPESKYMGEAAFWAGKSRERLGERARALTLYEWTSERYRYGYHGHMARRRAAALRAAEPRIRPETVAVGTDLERIKINLSYYEKSVETAGGSGADRIAKADDLELLGLTDLAIREMNEAVEAGPTSPRLNLRLAQIYSRRGDTFQATLILRRAYPDLFSYADSELPREAWEIFFPLRYWDIIKQEAKQYNIDPFVAAGLIRQESVFNSTAISRVGARGLMQLMPATAQQVARVRGTGQVTAADLYNPVLNVKLGMYYLSQRLNQFGRLEYAAAAYNAGPARAQQWIKERGSMDIEDWIENIPFSETRGYVQGVIRNSANYRRLYKE